MDKRIIYILCLILLFAEQAGAQFSRNGMNDPNAPTHDTSTNKTNNSNWHNETSRTEYKYLHSDKAFHPDTSIHIFHRRPFSQPWNRDLGNLGGPARNLLFTPDARTGPSFGYHAFDIYRFDLDSLHYYNTNKPYSEFVFQMGSKLEQLASIMHTQNVKPNWNFSIAYQRITSPGYYLIQRTAGDNANISTHYQSKNKHYELYGGVVYNKQQADENGGILHDSLLSDKDFNDRKTIGVAFQDDAYGNGRGSVQRSSVTNMLRDFSFRVQHGYTFGRTDTLYNEDSTHYSMQLTPRFSITHRFEYTTDKHLYKDLRPDSLRYVSFFSRGFIQTDSVFSQQRWEKTENRVLLSGFLGKKENQLQFSAGLGNRVDYFSSFFLKNIVSNTITSNYFIGGLKKEALKAGQWHYKADAIIYLTGAMAGNSMLSAVVGKELGNQWAAIEAGAGQNINSAPYNYTTYYNQFDTIVATFNKESVTQLFANISSDKIKASAGIRSYLINNYIYLNQKQLPAQYATTFNITQAWVRKLFVWRALCFDNEFTWQQIPASAPINIPRFMGRHQLSAETRAFKRSLKIAAGAEIRYHSAYTPAGYSPFFNRFYYQNTYSVTNKPEGSVFFNFKIKNFRAYLMGDQVQQLFVRNTIIAPGYAAQNFMIRFGFTWVLIN